MAEKVSWKSYVAMPYLGAYSLAGKVEEIVLTIKDVKKENVTSENGKTDQCVVLYFEEGAKNGVEVKPMVANRTNCKTITKLFNSEFMSDWVGKRITIYATQTRVGREMKDCLRIRDKAPEFKCSVCGKDIDEGVYNASVAKYGKAYCSKECFDKANTQQNESNE